MSRRVPVRGAVLLLLIVLSALSAPTASAHAQSTGTGIAAAGSAATSRGSAAGQPSAEVRLRQQQDELEKLRRERATLEKRMNDLQRSARTLADEVSNLEAQRLTTVRLVETLDRQLVTITREVDNASTGLSQAEAELRSKKEILRKRMVDIYKRGRLFDIEAMLSAQSFAALVARYKYLHELTLHDRSLVHRVEALRNRIAAQRALLVRLQEEITWNRTEKAREALRLRTLEGSRKRNLTVVQRTTEQTRDRLMQLARDESRVAGVIAALETARRRAEMAPNARPAAPSSIRTTDLGRLDWPVDGVILYRFGRVVNPNNTTTRWNGVGIGANVGSGVRSIAAGEVVLADAVGTYGPTVIVQHGGGDYSVYGSLARIDVRKGQEIAKGQMIGAVGATDPDLPPHLHFEIRPKGRAVDPLEWLRAQKR